MLKALVTGSTGFVGANLVEGLGAAGVQVRALQRPSSCLDALAGLTYQPIIGDVLDPASLASAMDGVDWVFHVAAVADYWRQDGAAWLYRVNVGGTRNVLEAALAKGVRRVVFTSSAASLGIPPHAKPVDETSIFNLSTAVSPYGHSKHLAEQVVGEYVDRGLDVVTVNPTVILGPRDLNLISGSLIVAIARRQVQVVPPGSVNYVDVSDIVAGQIAAAERGRAGERYLLAVHNMTHEQAAITIARIVGVSPPRIHLPRMVMGPLATAVDLFNRIWPGERLTDGNQVRLMPNQIVYDASKAQRELNLGPPVPFEVSVERTFHWYRANGYL